MTIWKTLATCKSLDTSRMRGSSGVAGIWRSQTRMNMCSGTRRSFSRSKDPGFRQSRSLKSAFYTGKWKPLVCMGLGVSGGIYLWMTRTKEMNQDVEPGKRNLSLPNYSVANVQQHDTIEKGVWVTYREGVYDVTKYVKYHPGGKKLLEAAGGPLEPYWQMYPLHNQRTVDGILEELRIGNINQDEINHYEQTVKDLVKMPQIDPSTYTLDIVIEGEDGLSMISFENLKTEFKPISAVVSSKCSSNESKDITAKWTGVLISDILKSIGLSSNLVELVKIQSLDKNHKGKYFEALIPSEKAFDDKCGIIVAYSMDEKELPQNHGYPLRLIVPGASRGQHVKMVKRIIVEIKH